MDEAVKQLQYAVTNVEKKIDTLCWKIKQFERVMFSEIETSRSCKLMSIMTLVAETCRKYDEIVLLVAKHKDEQIAFTDTLQLHVNLVKSKVETLTALITKGKTIEF